MLEFRKYGSGPYSIVLIHGGPGAPGMMKPLAQILSPDFGIIEPMQSKKTIMGQVEELKEILKKEGDPPLVLVGHSWGAWLAFIFSARELLPVKKIILIGSGPFQEKYVEKMKKTRQARMTEDASRRVKELQEEILKNPGNKEAFASFGEIMSKIDGYDPVNSETSILEFQPEVYAPVMGELNELRKSGGLLDLGKRIKCPVTAIHGDYDPHPYEGVKEPLEQTLECFSFFILEKCGHIPWEEKQARENFFRLLIQEIR